MQQLTFYPKTTEEVREELYAKLALHVQKSTRCQFAIITELKKKVEYLESKIDDRSFAFEKAS